MSRGIRYTDCHVVITLILCHNSPRGGVHCKDDPFKSLLSGFEGARDAVDSGLAFHALRVSQFEHLDSCRRQLAQHNHVSFQAKFTFPLASQLLENIF